MSRRNKISTVSRNFNFQLSTSACNSTTILTLFIYILFITVYIKREGVPHDNKVILYTYIYIYIARRLN